MREASVSAKFLHCGVSVLLLCGKLGDHPVDELLVLRIDHCCCFGGGGIMAIHCLKICNDGCHGR